MAVKKKSTVTKKSETKVAEPKKATSVLSVQVKDVSGKAAGTLTLPKAIFEAKVNPQLMSQAVRVYLANQRLGTHSTKTRGEVEGSTRKIYRQKGTGRARHGAMRAPIFVHGGVAHGPKPVDYSLSLSKKMKKAALFSALTAKLKDGELMFVSGLDSIEPKTKNMASAFKKLELDDKKRKVLLVLSKANDNEKTDSIKRAARNLEGVTLVSADRLNTYSVLNTKLVMFTKNAVTSLENHFLKGESK